MTIRNKFILYTILPLLVLFPLITYYLIQQQLYTQEERLASKIERINGLISTTNILPLDESDHHFVKQNCRIIAQDEEIVQLEMTDKRYTDTIFNFLNKAKLKDNYEKKKFTFQIKNEKQIHLADVKVVYTTEKIQKQMSQTLNSLLLLSFIALGILLFLYIKISNTISQPIGSIVSSLQKVDDGDLHHRLELAENNEFKQIQNHFNTMVEHIRISRENLEHTNELLSTEIEERKRTAKILANVISTIPYSVFWKDKNLTFIGCNHNFVKDNGFKSVTEIIGKKDADLSKNAVYIQNYVEIDKKIIEEKRPILEIEHTEIKNGKEIVFSTSKVPLYDENGEVVGVLGVYSDITERKMREVELKRAKETAERANEAKSDFLANMSHEIRTPMNGIMGMSDILLHTNLTKEQEKYVNIVRRSSEGLLQVINDILDISKIEAGKIELIEETFDFEQLLLDIMDAFTVSAHIKKINLLYNIATDVNTKLIGDPGRLKQILINIIGNAIKFTETGEVAIYVTNIKDENNEIQLQFEVNDTGIGIPEDKLDIVFDSFTQVDTSYNRRHSGTGLGLAISKRRVEMMKGSITVKSDLKKGSTFIFTPTFRYEEKKYPAYTYKNEALSDKHILIIDDNKQNVNILKNILQTMGCQTTSLLDSRTALEYLSREKIENQFDAILLDLHFDGQSGVRLLENVKSNTLLLSAIIMMTNSIDAKEAQIEMRRCKELGIGQFLVKPLKTREMSQAIIDTLTRQKSLKAELDKAKNEPQYHELQSHRNQQVLVVEDHEINQKITRIMLQQLGYDTVIARNGNEALKMFDPAYALILMDIQMPELDGMETTKQIRKLANGIDIPIIALTAHAQAGDRERFLKVGMNDYISKPYDPKEFIRVISQYLEVTENV